MSDPVTNVEIEDVLSSIRRLVSAEEREEEDETAPQQEKKVEGEKLVLTPAQRVDESPEPPASEDEAEYGYDMEPPFAPRRENRFDEVEDAEIVEGPVPDPEPDAVADHDDADGEAWEEASHDALALDDDTDGDAGPAASPATGEDDGEVDLAELEARIAGFEAAVAEQDDEWEPDGSFEDAYSAGSVTPLPWQDEDGRDHDPGADGPARTRDDASGSETGQDEDLPHGSGGARADAASWYSDDAVIDEDALRDMVSEIVREELQGALGERITRNVRKLVRREIHRALMSQGVE